MSETFRCPNCDDEIVVDALWDSLGRPFACPSCGTMVRTRFDESADGEQCWWWMEREE